MDPRNMEGYAYWFQDNPVVHIEILLLVGSIMNIYIYNRA